jgi:hypothetical protein
MGEDVCRDKNIKEINPAVDKRNRSAVLRMDIF